MKFKATLCTSNPVTEVIISERLVGHFNSEDEALFAAFKQRKEGEGVHVYGCKSLEESDESAYDMAVTEVELNDMARL